MAHLLLLRSLAIDVTKCLDCCKCLSDAVICMFLQCALLGSSTADLSCCHSAVIRCTRPHFAPPPPPPLFHPPFLPPSTLPPPPSLLPPPSPSLLLFKGAPLLSKPPPLFFYLSRIFTPPLFLSSLIPSSITPPSPRPNLCSASLLLMSHPSIPFGDPSIASLSLSSPQPTQLVPPKCMSAF